MNVDIIKKPKILMLTNCIYPDEFGGIPVSMYQIFNRFRNANTDFTVFKLCSKKSNSMKKQKKYIDYFFPRASILHQEEIIGEIKFGIINVLKNLKTYFKFFSFLYSVFLKKGKKEFKRFIYQVLKQLYLRRFIFIPLMEEYIKREQINLILVGSMFHNHYIGSFLKERQNLKSVIIVHGTDILNKNMSEDPQKLNYDVVITRTEYVKKLVVEKYNYPKDKIYIVPSGITTDQFEGDYNYDKSRAALGIDANTFQIVTVGRLVYRKGFDIVINAVKKLKKMDLNKEIRYVIIGNGEEKKEILRMIENYNLAGEIILLSNLNNHERNLWLSASDVFVMVPREKDRKGNSDVEGFGIVYLEANYLGVPAIGSKSGGVPEAIEDGVSGFLINQESVEELVETLINLINDENLRNILSKKAKKRIYKVFLWEKIFTIYFNIFQELIS